MSITRMAEGRVQAARKEPRRLGRVAAPAPALQEASLSVSGSSE